MPGQLLLAGETPTWQLAFGRQNLVLAPEDLRHGGTRVVSPALSALGTAGWCDVSDIEAEETGDRFTPSVTTGQGRLLRGRSKRP